MGSESVSYPKGPIYDYLWNWAWQIGLICVIAEGRISIWGHAQSLRAFMQTWRERYGEPQVHRVLSAESVERCGVEVLMPTHAFVMRNPAQAEERTGVDNA